MSELTLSASEIAAAITKGLEGYTPSVEARTVGRVAEIGDGIREKYRRRLKKLVDALNQVGFQAKMPGGTYFLYTRSPKGAGDRVFATAQDASQFLIHDLSISTVPWDDCGASLRFSVTYEAADEAAEDDLMAEAHARLSRARLKF